MINYTNFFIQHCANNSLTVSDIVGIVQVSVATITLFGLGVTIYYQYKSTEAQREVLELDRKAKRAEYFPRTVIEYSLINPTQDDGAGGTAPTRNGIYLVQLTLNILEKHLTSLEVSTKTNAKDFFKILPIAVVKDRIFKEGDEDPARFVFEYVLDDTVDNMVIYRDAFIEITFSYSDLIGNKYYETIRHDADNNASSLGLKRED